MATSWPDNFQGCTVTGQWTNLDGTPAAGTITFVASPASLLDRADSVIIVPITLSVTLDSTGSIPTSPPFVIPATDDPDINPTGWTYMVSENFSGGRRGYSIKAPQNTTISLPDVAPVPNALGTPIYRGEDGNPGILVLASGAPIPAGTPAGTIIARTPE